SRHGVQTKEIQASHAQVSAFDRPVVQARNPESAAVTDTLGNDLPGITKIVAVFPNDFRHIAEMLRLALANSEGNESPGARFAILLNLMGRHVEMNVTNHSRPNKQTFRRKIRETLA